MYTNNRKLDLNSYINTLWNYFQSYNKSFNKDNINQGSKWLNILIKSDLNLNRNTIIKLIDDPNTIFELTKYVDTSLNQIQVLKLKFYIIIYWLNYLLLIENNDKHSNTIFNFDHSILTNWSDTIDSITSVFESRNNILIYNKNTIKSSLKKLENIKLQHANIDNVHQVELESQLTTINYIIELESITILKQLNKNIEDLNNPKYKNMNDIFENFLHNERL